jgi:hypothetical protein
MKTLLENWKKFIKEARPQPLQQRVLHDIGGYSGDVTPGKHDDERKSRDKRKPSVGYGADEDLIDGVKVLMDKTPQDWMIIAAKNVGSVSTFANPIDKQNFKKWFDGWIKKWLDDRNKPEDFLDDTIFLVIQSPHLIGDSKGSQWFIHDVLGHSINYIYERQPGSTRSKFDLRFINYLQRKINGPATEDFDRISDVFASIILGNLSKEKMEEYAKEYHEVDDFNKRLRNLRTGPPFGEKQNNEVAEATKKTIEELLSFKDWWINSYLQRGPKNLNFVELWNPTDPNDK